MRNAMIRAGTIGATAVAGACAALTAAAPAYASAEWVEVTPSTVRAGSSVTVRASCGDNLNPARVTSGAFDDQLAVPQNGVLVATATVPPDKRPDSFLVRVTCPNGRAVTTKIHVAAMAAPVRGPDTGGGGLAAGKTGETPAILVVGLASLAAGGVLAVLRHRRRGAESAADDHLQEGVYPP